jgi:hypothetical protein
VRLQLMQCLSFGDVNCDCLLLKIGVHHEMQGDGRGRHEQHLHASCDRADEEVAVSSEVLGLIWGSTAYWQICSSCLPEAFENNVATRGIVAWHGAGRQGLEKEC